MNIDKESGVISIQITKRHTCCRAYRAQNVYSKTYFGNLLTSTNYDSKEKIVGGRMVMVLN